jgi:hypothetical protein
LERAELVELFGFRDWGFSLRFRIPSHTVYTSLESDDGVDWIRNVFVGGPSEEERVCALARGVVISISAVAVTSRHWQFAKEVPE